MAEEMRDGAQLVGLVGCQASAPPLVHYHALAKAHRRHGRRGIIMRPLHFSLYANRGLIRRVPSNMTRARITDEQRMTATRVAIDIFEDCLRAGVTFQDTLLAIYLSGLQHGQEITKEEHHDTPESSDG